MTIDEAITHAREVAEEQEQLAEWLEELKTYRQIKALPFYEKGREDAIEEYKHKLITDVSARAQSFEKIHDKHDSEIFNYATRTFVDALKFFEKRVKGAEE